MADCRKCGGCGASVSLNSGELSVLRLLGQYSFLPVGAWEKEIPALLGEGDLSQEEYGRILPCLEKKGLVNLEWDKPLKGFCDYGDYPHIGSLGLTARGQAVLELLEIQGAQ